MKRVHYYWLFGALLVGLLVRIPGVFWGYNFPTGWYGHHVDEWTHLVNAEVLINPRIPARWHHPYPKGMAAHVAIPFIGLRLLQGKMFDELPAESHIIVTGRVVSVLYGTATILILFLLARRLFRDPRVALLSAWLLALGGLHVTQSHFFVSDVSSIFWFLLGLYLLFFELDSSNKSDAFYLMLASFCFGISFGLKLLVFALPTLAVITLLYRPRFRRSIQVLVFFFAGFFFINLASYSPYDLVKTFYKGVGDPYQFHWWSNLLLYLIEAPSLVSFPVVLLSLGGIYFIVKRFVSARNDERFLATILIVITPLTVSVLLIIFKLDHFPRHIVSLIPWICILTAWTLVKLTDKLKLKGLKSSLVIIPIFFYLCLFVYDGERVFIQEPRNDAARWLLQNVSAGTDISWVYHGRMPGYHQVLFPTNGRPTVLVMEMHEANHYLSGMGLKNSYPENYRAVFDCPTPSRLRAFQTLFRGESEYKEIARFKEGYFMPEYRLVDNLIGNRSRNYVAEIVIFIKKTAHYSKN